MAALTLDTTTYDPALEIRPRPALPARPTTRSGELPRWARLEAHPGRGGATTTARRRRTHPAVLRRRRLVAVAAVVVLAFIAGVVLALTLTSVPAGGSLTEEAREARRVTYVVQPGDNLWRAAAHLAPAEDPRAVVDALTQTRGTTSLLPGETLAWPTS